MINTIRPKEADPDTFAYKISKQVDSLLVEGFKIENITLLGASKGAYITLLANANYIKKNLNTVVLGICGEDFIRYFTSNNLFVYGNVLSIYESSDDLGKTCEGLNKGPFIQNFKEITLNTGLKHGFLFKSSSTWIQPSLKWAKNDFE